MDHWIWAIVCPIIAYFIGAIPFSFFVTKLKTGKDLRKVGTKNVGGLNTVLTTGSVAIGIFAGFLDYCKGLACVLTVRLIPFDDTPLFGNNPKWQLSWHSIIYILVATTVVLGHNFSVYLKFKGGRGMGTSAGIFCLANPLLVILNCISALILIALTRYVRLSQFFAMLVVTLPVAFFLPIFPPWLPPGLDIGFVTGLMVSGIVLVTLPKYVKPTIDAFRGKEYKIGKEKIIFKDESEEKQTSN